MSSEQKPFRHQDYLGHMLEAIQLSQSYIEGMAKEDFLQDKKTQQAVILNIVILGEAATKLVADCPEFVNQHPEIPWQQMRGMRNRMAHGYFEINLDIIWDTVQTALPDLERQIRAI